jgi:hypothetical protein
VPESQAYPHAILRVNLNSFLYQHMLGSAGRLPARSLELALLVQVAVRQNLRFSPERPR